MPTTAVVYDDTVPGSRTTDFPPTSLDSAQMLIDELEILKKKAHIQANVTSIRGILDDEVWVKEKVAQNIAYYIKRLDSCLRKVVENRDKISVEEWDALSPKTNMDIYVLLESKGIHDSVPAW